MGNKPASSLACCALGKDTKWDPSIVKFCAGDGAMQSTCHGGLV